VLRRTDGEAGTVARRELAIGAALAASWLAIWGLYSAYTWTTDPTSVTVQVVRFYIPAIGAIALLGAWLVTRIPGRTWRTGLASAAVAGVREPMSFRWSASLYRVWIRGA
jgi:hypothetical protein